MNLCAKHGLSYQTEYVKGGEDEINGNEMQKVEEEDNIIYLVPDILSEEEH